MGYKFSFLLISNGTLITQEVAGFISDNKEVSIWNWENMGKK